MNGEGGKAMRMARVSAVWAIAAGLAACGGGGGGSGDGNVAASPAAASANAQAPDLGSAPAPGPAPSPSPSPSPSPAPSPAPAPAPAPAGPQQQAVANGSYTISANDGQTWTIVLPRNQDLQAGDRVTVTGVGTSAWRLAQNDQQWIDTRNLPGNVTPGTVWTPRTVDAATPNQNWFATASSADGNRLAAVARPGGLYLSQDGGATWTRSSAPSTDWAWVSMSADGSRLAAVASGGAMHLSADGGATWTAAAAPGQPWTGVHLSDDGQRIVATAVGGGMFRSTNGGATFTAIPGTAGGDWRAVAGSRDGQRLVATASLYASTPALQGVYVSSDGGATWTRRLGNGNWAYATASADGQRMAAIDNGNNPWVSDDGGATFTIRFGFSNWSGLAVSGNGQVVSALEPRDDANNHTGYTFVSPDGGTSWNWYGENRWYRGVSLSFDGNWMVVGDTGPNGTGGRIYTSQGNRTAIGPLGAIGGGQGQMLEVTYQGNGRFTVTGRAGGPFTIR